MDIIGYTYHQERTFNTLEGAAKNPGSPAAVMGTGLGMGLGMAGPMYETARHMFDHAKPQEKNDMQIEQKACTKCGMLNGEEARFCSGCGQPFQAPAEEAPAKAILCNDCGQPLAPNAKFCLHCGDPYHACPKCGHDHPAGAAECPDCGAPLPMPCRACGELVDAEAKFCPHCGSSHALTCPGCDHEIKPGQKFCMECGHKLM